MTQGFTRIVKSELGRGTRDTTPASGARHIVLLLVVSSALNIIALAIGETSRYAGYLHVGLMIGVLATLLVSLIVATRLLRRLRAAQDAEREARATSNSFFARMSQELRTLLNRALDGIEALRGGRAGSATEQSLLSDVHDATSTSIHYLDSVADFCAIEVDRITLARTEFDLHALLNGVATNMRRAASQKDMTTMVRIAPDVPFWLIGDSHCLRAILLHLTSATMLYADRGRLWLDVTKRVESAGSATLRFEVIENAGVMRNVWKRFFAHSHGDGSFVAVAQRLVERMGGRIGMENVNGDDAFLWFELPFAKQHPNTNDAPIANGRAVVLSADAQLVASFARLFPCQLVQATSLEELVGMLTQTSRLGNAFYLALIDDRVIANPAVVSAGLGEPALALNVPVILVTDRPPAGDKLRELGVTAVLSRTPSADHVYAVLHASPSWAAASDPKVATVAPWLLSDREKATRPRILLADDIQTNLLVTSRMLEEAGYDVEAVSSGEEALQRLLAGGYRLAVLDMHMPGFDGPDVLRRYRASRPRFAVPIIMLTANVSIDAQQACAEAGADAYLAKPVTAAQLLGEVRRLINMNKVEVVPFGGKTTSIGSIDDSEVLDVSVLAELDRLCRDPRELASWIHEYEREGRSLLQQITTAEKSRNHQAYCDAIHALKSTAANVGARKLMAACQRAGTLEFADFLSEPAGHTAMLRRDFEDSMAALHQLHTRQDERESRG